MVPIFVELEALVRRCLKQAQDADHQEGIQHWSAQLRMIEELKQKMNHSALSQRGLNFSPRLH